MTKLTTTPTDAPAPDSEAAFSAAIGVLIEEVQVFAKAYQGVSQFKAHGYVVQFGGADLLAIKRL